MTNGIEKAIRLAVEGGYLIDTLAEIKIEGDIVWGVMTKNKEINHGIRVSEVLLDPIFWQSLGKALAWGKETTDIYRLTGKAEPFATVEHKEGTDDYKYHWHRFIDHLADSKDPEEFFNQLIK